MLLELQANVADTSKEAAVENAETTSEEDETKPENIETSKPETAELEMAEKEAGDGDFQNLMAYIEEQIESNDFDCWMEVAECEYVTSEQLVAIAQNCAKIECYNGYNSMAEGGQLAMAEIILENPALTENVLKEFVNSEYASVVSLEHQTIETIETVANSD